MALVFWSRITYFCKLDHIRAKEKYWQLQNDQPYLNLVEIFMWKGPEARPLRKYYIKFTLFDKLDNIRTKKKYLQLQNDLYYQNDWTKLAQKSL